MPSGMNWKGRRVGGGLDRTVCGWDDFMLCFLFVLFHVNVYTLSYVPIEIVSHRHQHITIPPIQKKIQCYQALLHL